MAKRKTTGRKPRSTKAKTASQSDVVESLATDVTDDTSSNLNEKMDDIEPQDVSADDVLAELDKAEDRSADATDITDETEKAAPTDTAEASISPEPVDAEEIVYTTPAAAAAPVVVRKGGFVPMVLGGAVAAGLGFAASESDMLDSVLPASWQDQEMTADLTPLTDKIESQSALIATLEEKINSISEVEAVDLSGVDTNATAIAAISTEIESVTGSVGSVTETLTAIDTRLTTLEKSPIADSVSPAAIEAYERELASLSETIAAQRAEVEQTMTEALNAATTAEAKENEARAAELTALAASIAAQREDVDKMLTDAKAVEEEAVEAAKTAEVKLALSNVVSAIDAGDPFTAELATLSAAGGPDIPDALKAVAETGLPTLAALQDSFPAVARQALTAARAEVPEAEGSGGLASILQRSLGARSTKPREGDDPDAVLSRAEAALKDGDVEKTLSEIEKLPDGSKTVMADWLAQAAARQEARTAADALSASLNTN